MTTTLIAPAGLLNFAKGTVTATDETITLTRLSTLGGVAVELYGTWSGTATFEALVDTNWVSIALRPSTVTTTALDVTSATANGAWSFQDNGYKAVRVRFSTASSGTLGVAIRSVQQRL